MGADDSKFAKPEAESTSDIINPENELSCESTNLNSTNNLPERDPKSYHGLKNSASLLERADSALDKDLGVLIVEPLKNTEKSTFNVDNMKTNTTSFTDVEQGEIDLDRSHSNIPLINEKIQSNLPLLLDNCQSNSPLILNKSQSESPILLDNKSRSSPQAFIDNSLANSPIFVHTNQSKSPLLPPVDQFQHSVLNDCEILHDAVQPSCSVNLHKSAVKSGIFTEVSLFDSDLKDFTLTSIKTDVEEEAVQPSCSENLHKSAEKCGIVTEASLFGSDLKDFTLTSIKTDFEEEAVQPSCSENLNKSAEKCGIGIEASLFGSDLKDFTLTSIKADIEEDVQPSCSDHLHNSAEKSGIATESSVSGSGLKDFTLPSVKPNIQKYNTKEPNFLSSIFIEESNDFNLRSQYKNQLKNSPNRSKIKYAQEPRNIKETKDRIVPETLKEVERVANRLCSYTATIKKTHSNVKPYADQHVLPPKPLKVNLITQQVILNNLEYMNNFMLDLKSSPIFDEKVLFSLKSLKKSISSLISHGHNVSDDQDLDLAFKLLLDSLPDNFQKEKENVSFENGVPFCKTCKQHLATNFLIVIKHLEGENHQKLLRGYEEKYQDVVLPSACKNDSKINKVSFQNENNVSKLEPTLQKNHEGVLEIVYNSKVNNLDMNLSLYICIVCDYWANDEKIAKIHLTDKSHIVQLNADWSFCSSCKLNIFGTADNFEEHCSSLMHMKILGVSDEISQNRITEKEIETCNLKEDNAQVSGSRSSSSASSRVELKQDTSNKESDPDESSDEESSDETESFLPPKKEFMQEDEQENVVVLRNGTCISGKINSV